MSSAKMAAILSRGRWVNIKGLLLTTLGRPLTNDIWTGFLSAHELGLSQWEWEVHMQLLLLAKNL